jgi:hypothetical protein
MNQWGGIVSLHYLLPRHTREASYISGAINNTHIVLLKFAITLCIIRNVNMADVHCLMFEWGFALMTRLHNGW